MRLNAFSHHLVHQFLLTISTLEFVAAELASLAVSFSFFFFCIVLTRDSADSSLQLFLNYFFLYPFIHIANSEYNSTSMPWVFSTAKVFFAHIPLDLLVAFLSHSRIMIPYRVLEA
jgi:hypothetical protein